MTLKEFLSIEGNSAAKVAAVLCVSQPTVTRYANGDRWPDREMIIRIKEATGGAVDFPDWFQTTANEAAQ